MQRPYLSTAVYMIQQSDSAVKAKGFQLTFSTVLVITVVLCLTCDIAESVPRGKATPEFQRNLIDVCYGRRAESDSGGLDSVSLIAWDSLPRIGGAQIVALFDVRRFGEIVLVPLSDSFGLAAPTDRAALDSARSYSYYGDPDLNGDADPDLVFSTGMGGLPETYYLYTILGTKLRPLAVVVAEGDTLVRLDRLQFGQSDDIRKPVLFWGIGTNQSRLGSDELKLEWNGSTFVAVDTIIRTPRDTWETIEIWLRGSVSAIRSRSVHHVRYSVEEPPLTPFINRDSTLRAVVVSQSEKPLARLAYCNNRELFDITLDSASGAFLGAHSKGVKPPPVGIPPLTRQDLEHFIEQPGRVFKSLMTEYAPTSVSDAIIATKGMSVCSVSELYVFGAIVETPENDSLPVWLVVGIGAKDIMGNLDSNGKTIDNTIAVLLIDANNLRLLALGG